MYHLKLHQAMSFVKSRQTLACLDFQVARNTGNEFRAGACNRSHEKPKTLLVMNPTCRKTKETNLFYYWFYFIILVYKMFKVSVSFRSTVVSNPGRFISSSISPVWLYPAMVYSYLSLVLDAYLLHLSRLGNN